MAGFRIEGNTSGNVAEVTTSNEVKVSLTTAPDEAGYVILATLEDEGTLTGTRLVNPVASSEYNRLKVGLDSLYNNDSFNATAQNTATYRAPVTTQTVTYGSGYVVLNGSSITTINTSCAYQTYRSFPIFGEFDTMLTLTALHTAAPQANAVTEWGLFTATLPGSAAPTDGAFFRFTAAGEFHAVINYNGAETNSASLPIPAANENHDYDIHVGQNVVRFIADDIVQAELTTPAGNGMPFAQCALPFTVRHYIAGSGPSSAMQFKVSSITVQLEDMNTTRTWPHVMSGMGFGCSQGQNGGTMGSTAGYANSANPTAAVATNTTAALGTGLGGQFWETDTLAVNNDGIIASFQNPAGGIGQTPRNLYVTGIGLSSYVQTVLVGGPYIAQWSIAYGHTAVSLATAESATAKAPRRIPLGYTQAVTVAQAVNTKVGTDYTVKFDVPILVQPGEFFQLVKKKIGTAPSSGVVGHVVQVDGYFE